MNMNFFTISSEIGVQYFGFITPFFDILKTNKEIVVDATCKYNFLNFFVPNLFGKENVDQIKKLFNEIDKTLCNY